MRRRIPHAGRMKGGRLAQLGEVVEVVEVLQSEASWVMRVF
jgi:hypothetical protein